MSAFYDKFDYSSYWTGSNYLGLGPSAHSFNGSSRQWNIANNSIYIKSVNEDKIPFEKEELTETQKLNEYIMTSLRTAEGLRLDITGKEMLDKSESYITAGLMKLENNALILTKEGKLLADGIAAKLFF